MQDVGGEKAYAPDFRREKKKPQMTFSSDGGDLYVWGWNESGQLGLPSRGLRKAPQQRSIQQAGKPQNTVNVIFLLTYIAVNLDTFV